MTLFHLHEGSGPAARPSAEVRAQRDVAIGAANAELRTLRSWRRSRGEGRSRLL